MRNIEIKARISNFSNFLKIASEISDCPEKVLIQTDTYFKTFNGRLKLRQIEVTVFFCLAKFNKTLEYLDSIRETAIFFRNICWSGNIQVCDASPNVSLIIISED